MNNFKKVKGFVYRNARSTSPDSDSILKTDLLMKCFMHCPFIRMTTGVLPMRLNLTIGMKVQLQSALGRQL